MSPLRTRWKYLTGEQILKGDVVRLGSLDGIVVAIVTKGSPEWIDYIGEGVTLEGPAFGRLHTPFVNEDLILVCRGEE